MRKAIIALFLVAAFAGGVLAQATRMTIRVPSGTVVCRATEKGLGVYVDPVKASQRLLTYLQNNAPSVTTDAQYDSAVDALTTTQLTTMTREVFKALFTVVQSGAPNPQ